MQPAACPSCSHAREKDKGEHLTEADLRRILDRLPWSPARVILSGIGKPLLNPQFFALVDLLAARRIKCGFFTNGTLLTPPTRQAILSRTNIDTVNISCDGARKETFENLRVGAEFDRWRRLVGEFVTEARQQRGNTLSVGANVVISKGNLHELDDIVRLAAELGFSGVYVMHAIPVDDMAADLCPSPAELAAVREEDLAALAGSLGLKVHCSFWRNARPPEAMPRCLQPWEYVFVRTKGEVAPCCTCSARKRRP